MHNTSDFAAVVHQIVVHGSVALTHQTPKEYNLSAAIAIHLCSFVAAAQSKATVESDIGVQSLDLGEQT